MSFVPRCSVHPCGGLCGHAQLCSWSTEDCEWTRCKFGANASALYVITCEASEIGVQELGSCVFTANYMCVGATLPSFFSVFRKKNDVRCKYSLEGDYELKGR